MRKILTSKYLFTLFVAVALVSWAGSALDTDDAAFSFPDSYMDVVLPEALVPYTPEFFAYLHRGTEFYPGGTSTSFLAMHEKSPPALAFSR